MGSALTFRLQDIIPSRKEIPGFPGYVADVFGSVWSAWIPGRYPRIGDHAWRLLKPDYSRDGHASLWLSQGGKQVRHYVHHLILWAFVGPAPDGMEACHRNGDRADNRIENLRWDTHAGNQADNIRNGTTTKGTRNARAILGEGDVIQIRRRLAGGEKRRALAKEYGYSDLSVLND